MKILYLIIISVCVVSTNADTNEAIMGQKGSQGEPGFPGHKGDKGAKGDEGRPGYHGVPGIDGEKGHPGYTGPPGLNGEKGRPGYPGMPGAKGDSGQNGAIGPKGELGPVGPKGSKGDEGWMGIPGNDGEQGDSGQNGAIGPKGELGPVGPMGPIGPQGLIGLKGQKGLQGSTPEIDYYKLKGDKGESGFMGERGRPGAVGPQGPPGVCIIAPNGTPIVLGPHGQPEPLGQSVFLRTNTTTTTSSLSETREVKYTLLQPTNNTEAINNDSYYPGQHSYKFTSGLPVQVDPSTTGLVGLNLSAPFIVTAIFKSYTRKSSCIFSISQNESTTMSLCIQAAGFNVSRVTLYTELYSPTESISFLFGDNFYDKWTKLVLYVKDNTVDLYVNCKKQPEKLTLVKSKKYVLLSKDMKLQLAYSTSPKSNFKGLIEEISFHTNADDNTLVQICQPRSIPNSNNFEENKTPEEPRPLPIEYINFKRDLNECRREITGIKNEMRKLTIITSINRSKVIQDIDELKLITEQLKLAQNKNG